MIVLDANILLYAYHPRSQNHERCRRWVEQAFSGGADVRLPWASVLAFLRSATNSRVFEHPLTISEAASTVSSWLAQPGVSTLEPGERYWAILHDLLRDSQAAGPLVMDAALAALALEHGALLCTSDRDFARFAGLKTLNPLVD